MRKSESGIWTLLLLALLVAGSTISAGAQSD